VRFLQDLYLREQLMIDLRYHLALAFGCIAVDGNQFSFAIGFHSMLVQPLS